MILFSQNFRAKALQAWSSLDLLAKENSLFGIPVWIFLTVATNPRSGHVNMQFQSAKNGLEIVKEGNVRFTRIVAVLWRKEESTRGANEETGTVNRYIPSGEADCTEHRSPQSRLGSWRNSVTRHQASSSLSSSSIALLPSFVDCPPHKPHRLKNTAADQCIQRIKTTTKWPPFAHA